ncbi:MAG: hypothetical protein KJ737_21940 [Proteobacteria bacterium]|nr:hypothetical protein [Pseudomonadota bacterium]
MKKFYRSVFISGAVILFMGICSSAMAEDVKIHGFISQGYLKTDKNNYLTGTDDGSFQFNEMGINFTTNATSRLKIGCQFFARDLGSVGNDEIVVNWAFAEYNFRNWLGLRTGLVKMPFGFYNDTRDYDVLRTSIFLPSSVYNENLRDGSNSIKGVELFGAQSIGLLGLFKYQIMAGATQIPADSGTAKLLEIQYPGMEMTSIDVGPVYDAQIQWLTPLDGFRLGVTYVKTDFSYDAVSNDTLPVRASIRKSEWYSYSVEYIWQNWTFSAENYILKRKAKIYSVATGEKVFLFDGDIDLAEDDSYYLRLSYRFTDWLETGFYYSKYVDDEKKKNDENKLRDQCLSLRFDINPYWIVKLETHLMNGKFGVEPDDHGRAYNEWMLYAAKMTFMF